jgi:hypothetical protein
MEERLKILIAELNAQWQEILKLHSAIETKSEALKNDRDNEDLTNSLGYKLHNLYSAYEDLFKLIAKFFENQVDNMSRYHTDLIKRMRIDMEGIRPALLSDESFKIIDELRGFRHVFRHAYSYELDAEKVIRVAEKSTKLKEIFSEDFETFKKRCVKTL